MIHRECGVLKTTYEADMALYPLPIARWTVAAVAVLMVAVLPLTLHEYYLSIINLISVAVVGALGLNILVGYTGQISIGHGAFMSVGAYTAANFAVRLDWPWAVNLLLGGLMAALVGAIVGIPSLRIKGLYLAIATLAGQLIIEWTINHVTFISGGVQASIEVPRPTLFGYVLSTQTDMYFFLLFFVVLALIGTLNLMRSRVGRAFSSRWDIPPIIARPQRPPGSVAGRWSWRKYARSSSRESDRRRSARPAASGRLVSTLMVRAEAADRPWTSGSRPRRRAAC